MTFSLTIKRNARARRLILRVNPTGAVVTAPRRISEREIMRFVARHEDWLQQQQSFLPAMVPFAPGALFPFQGEPHEIRLSGSLRGQIVQQDGIILLPCLAEHVARRLRQYLKNEARVALAEAVTKHATTLSLRPPAISLRDTTSRWGSCSASGTLSFSWRLIMAPPHVLDYVAAHEVAHIREMNHGPRFWQLCDSLVDDMETARAWLRKHGSDLHRYGRSV